MTNQSQVIWCAHDTSCKRTCSGNVTSEFTSVVAVANADASSRLVIYLMCPSYILCERTWFRNSNSRVHQCSGQLLLKLMRRVLVDASKYLSFIFVYRHYTRTIGVWKTYNTSRNAGAVERPTADDIYRYDMYKFQLLREERPTSCGKTSARRIGASVRFPSVRTKPPRPLSKSLPVLQ